ncbi:MAG TPA: helix-turn-helix domain-containing protein [Microvirga sp.]|nr:helix-turn-helix domain-containing protein [Microvirga sp.]
MDPQAAAKADFAERLRGAMERKGWSASEVARQVARHLETRDKFGRAHIWHYLQGRALPRSRYLLALSRALEVEPGELLPDRSVPIYEPARPSVFEGRSGASSNDQADLVHVRDFGDGTAMLEVHKRLPWETALQLIQILKASHTTSP